MFAPKPDAESDKAKYTDKYVLIVDDDKNVRNVIRTMLESIGVNVDEAQDGVDGLKMLHRAEKNNTPYDLILLDLVMPRMSGTECLSNMREYEVWRDLPVVMMSAFSSLKKIDADEHEELNILEFFDKPIRLEKLTATLDSL